ncbi:MAG: CopD family protein, partial [Ilumatobacteraceae bacterium]
MALFLGDRRTHADVARRSVKRFSRAATIALPVVVAAGSVLGWRTTGGRWTNEYTGRLILKIAVVALAALLGFLARRRIREQFSRRSLYRVFVLDSALLVVATVLAASISASPPPVHRTDRHQHQAVTAGGADGIEIGGCNTNVEGLAVRVSLSPGRIGRNDARLAVGWIDANTEGSFALRLTSEAIGAATLSVGLEPSTATIWSGAATFPVSGIWTLEVEYRPDEFTVRRGTCRVAIA